MCKTLSLLIWISQMFLMKFSNNSWIYASIHLHLLFYEKSLNQFWCAMYNSYPNVTISAFHVLLPFASTYLCKAGFLCLPNIKSKARNINKIFFWRWYLAGFCNYTAANIAAGILHASTTITLTIIASFKNKNQYTICSPFHSNTVDQYFSF